MYDLSVLNSDKARGEGEKAEARNAARINLMKTVKTEFALPYNNNHIIIIIIIVD